MYLMESSEQVDIAVAFVKHGGLRRLVPSIEELNEAGKSVRIVFGLSSSLGITDKESAQELLRLSRLKNVTVKKIGDSRFHPKLYIFHGNPRSIALGSSNLTNAAAEKNVEANILVENPAEEVFREAEKLFNSCFCIAQELTCRDVEEYNPRRPTRNGRSGESPRGVEIPPQYSIYPSPVTLEDLLNEMGKDYFYIMHLSYGDYGRKKECWDYAYKHSRIGLDYDIVKGDWAKIRDKVKDKLSDPWVRQFDLFCTDVIEESMEIGDIVLAIYGQTHLLGIGKVIGNHYYDKKLRGIFFDHLRRVRWIRKYTFEKKRPIPQLHMFMNTLEIVRKGKKRWLILSPLILDP